MKEKLAENRTILLQAE